MVQATKKLDARRLFDHPTKAVGGKPTGRTDADQSLYVCACSRKACYRPARRCGRSRCLVMANITDQRGISDSSMVAIALVFADYSASHGSLIGYVVATSSPVAAEI